MTEIISNEQKPTIRDNLILLSLRIKIGDSILIRLDPHSSHKSLQNDKTLADNGIILEIGDAKNSNHNGCAEKAVLEVKSHILKISPTGGPVSPVTLARATSNLNKIIRANGLSSQELWTSRNQLNGQNLTIDDKTISDNQFNLRQSNCAASAKHKVRGSSARLTDMFEKGQIVFVKSDKTKSSVRDRYIIIDLDKEKRYAMIQKLLDKNPKKNTLRVDFQNLYLAGSKSPFPTPLTNSSTKPLKSILRSTPMKSNPDIPPFKPSTPPHLFRKKFPSATTCNYCRNAGYSHSNHDPLKCSLMLRANPSQYVTPVLLSPVEESDEEITPNPCRALHVNIADDLQLSFDDDDTDDGFSTDTGDPDEEGESSVRPTSERDMPILDVGDPQEHHDIHYQREPDEQRDILDQEELDFHLNFHPDPNAIPDIPVIHPFLHDIPILDPVQDVPVLQLISAAPADPPMRWITTPTPNNRVVRPGQYVKFLEEKASEEDEDEWVFAKITHMAAKEIRKWPAWYNIRTCSIGIPLEMSKEFIHEDQGRTWMIVSPDEVPLPDHGLAPGD